MSSSLRGSFILPLYTAIFGLLRKLSLFFWVRRWIPDRSYHAFVDIWVMGHFIAAAVCAVAVPLEVPATIGYMFLAYGALRCFELAVLHVNQLLFDEYRLLRDGKPPPPLNSRRLIVHLLHNYVEVVLWFSFFYRNGSSHFVHQLPLDTAWGSIYFSIVTMATVGFGDVTAKDRIGAFLLIAQISLGVFMAIAVIARWLSTMQPIGRKDIID